MTLDPIPGPPRISVLIPTYNRAAMLAEAVDSALAQSWPNLEIIVSDNASTDGTAEVMARYRGEPRLRYHRNPANLGAVGNFRQAIRDLATGDFFVLLSDDDCLLDSDYLAKAARIIQDHPKVVMVYGEGYLLDMHTGQRTELRLPFREVEPGTRVFASRNRIHPQDFTMCNVLFHRILTMELDAFSDPRDLCCDSELFLMLCLCGEVGVVKGMVSLYRWHGANLVKTVQGDPDLMIHSLNLFIRPYRMALDKGTLSPRERADFERTARTAFMHTLLIMLDRHPSRYPDLVDVLRRSVPGQMRKLYRWPRFIRKLITLKVRRSLFRRPARR
jgi:glycosyltransferase involved in cell wall biosynthesis